MGKGNSKSNSNGISLAEVNQSVDTRGKVGFFKKLFAFLGPAYLVSVGYMDPGNWATDIAGGSQFGYTLIWVLLMSNLMALLLQSLSARLGIVAGRDLAQASRDTFPRPVNFFLYVLAEIAIAACDLAEVLGMAIGLQLLFGLPLIWGVSISVLDTFLLLFLMNYGIRKIEAFIIALVSIIGISFFIEMLFAKPEISEIAKGFVPHLPSNTALYIAIGIIGATVMPHNLYLHSSLVQTRKFNRDRDGIKKAIKFNIIDSVIALNLAFFVNAAILILAASTFFNNGLFEVAEIQDAHKFLEPLLGTAWAPALFAIALIAAGQSSTVTGTLAGQIIMEGYLNLRLQPWIRRLITRSIAVVPALITIAILGESSTGPLLVLSQVILSLQLGFAVIPLIHFVSNKTKMGEHVISTKIKVLAWLSATIIVSLNVKLVYGQIVEWIANAGDKAWIFQLTIVPLAGAVFLVLLYITFIPIFKKQNKLKPYKPHGLQMSIHEGGSQNYKRIAIAVDFSSTDEASISSALSLGGKEANYLMIHVLESAGAIVMGSEIQDLESQTDQAHLQDYANQLQLLGYNAEAELGFGNPKKEIPKLVQKFNADLLIMGAHGHKGLKDVLFGTTLDAVRHRVSIPVFIVK